MKSIPLLCVLAGVVLGSTVVDSETGKVVFESPDVVANTVVETDLIEDDDDDDGPAVKVTEVQAAQLSEVVPEVIEQALAVEQAHSVVDVNAHQHSTFVDKDNDVIEDLSEDLDLDLEDELLEEQTALATTKKGSLLDDIFNSPDGDYVEELVDSEGHHTRKEVHTGLGYKTVTITSDTPLALNEVLSQMFGGIPNDFPMHLEGDSLIEAMNQRALQRQQQLLGQIFGQDIFGFSQPPPMLAEEPEPTPDDHALVLAPQSDAEPTQKEDQKASSNTGKREKVVPLASAKPKRQRSDPANLFYNYVIMGIVVLSLMATSVYTYVVSNKPKVETRCYAQESLRVQQENLSTKNRVVTLAKLD